MNKKISPLAKLTITDPSKKKISIKQVSQILIALIGIATVLVCLSFGMQIVSGIALGIMMSSGGDTVLHSDPNTSNTIIVHAVSDDCGATCDCSTRIDITF